MTLAIAQVQHQPISLDEFIARYGGDNRYELIDGEIFDLEPTGQHEEVAALITAKICVQIDQLDLPWFVLQRGLFRPSSASMTAFRPDYDGHRSDGSCERISLARTINHHKR